MFKLGIRGAQQHTALHFVVQRLFKSVRRLGLGSVRKKWGFRKPSSFRTIFKPHSTHMNRFTLFLFEMLDIVWSFATRTPVLRLFTLRWGLQPGFSKLNSTAFEKYIVFWTKRGFPFKILKNNFCKSLLAKCIDFVKIWIIGPCVSSGSTQRLQHTPRQKFFKSLFWDQGNLKRTFPWKLTLNCF